MPMPYALDHVNVYLLRVAAGWLIIDTGIDSAETRGIWEEVFSGPLRGEAVVGVDRTHYHVDHLGLAGYLTERWRVPLFISAEEYFTLGAGRTICERCHGSTPSFSSVPASPGSCCRRP